MTIDESVDRINSTLEARISNSSSTEHAKIAVGQAVVEMLGLVVIAMMKGVMKK
jgi:hypothetical protein